MKPLKKYFKYILILSIPLIFVNCSNQDYEHLSYYEDGEFQNLEGKYDLTLWDVFVWRTMGERGAWPEPFEKELNKNTLPERSTKPLITFINHSTFLIQVDGINILTDPVFSERVSPSQCFGPKRFHNVTIPKEKIPKVDVIIISHNHYDHLDYDSLEFFK